VPRFAGKVRAGVRAGREVIGLAAAAVNSPGKQFDPSSRTVARSSRSSGASAGGSSLLIRSLLDGEPGRQAGDLKRQSPAQPLAFLPASWQIAPPGCENRTGGAAAANDVGITSAAQFPIPAQVPRSRSNSRSRSCSAPRLSALAVCALRTLQSTRVTGSSTPQTSRLQQQLPAVAVLSGAPQEPTTRHPVLPLRRSWAGSRAPAVEGGRFAQGHSAGWPPIARKQAPRPAPSPGQATARPHHLAQRRPRALSCSGFSHPPPAPGLPAKGASRALSPYGVRGLQFPPGRSLPTWAALPPSATLLPAQSGRSWWRKLGSGCRRQRGEWCTGSTVQAGATPSTVVASARSRKAEPARWHRRGRAPCSITSNSREVRPAQVESRGSPRATASETGFARPVQGPADLAAPGPPPPPGRRRGWSAAGRPKGGGSAGRPAGSADPSRKQQRAAVHRLRTGGIVRRSRQSSGRHSFATTSMRHGTIVA